MKKSIKLWTLKKQEADAESTSLAQKALTAAYHVLGGKVDRLIPVFKDLDLNLERAGLKVNFKAYISLAVITSIINTVLVCAALFLVTAFAFHMQIASVLLFSLSGALLAGAISIMGFYIYPIYRADKHKRELEDELPFTTGYMSILATAGVTPEQIFNSIANLKAPLAASVESKEIIKNVNLFGYDVISALEKISSRTTSKKFKEIIEGLISTIHTGSDLGSYLRKKFKTAIKLRKASLKKYSATLSFMSEIYVAVLLTGPLLLAIMVCIMSVLGNGTIGALSPELILSLLTYIAIPVCGLMFIIILDMVAPKW